jgi:hypothetical protein
LPGSRSDDCNFVYFENKEVYVRTLEDFELAEISGGDHWGYENSSGGIDEDRSTSYANSYQNSDGSWGSSSAYAQACNIFGNVVEGALVLGGASLTVAWPIGQSAEAWCSNGFVGPSAGSGSSDSNFNGGGASGSWAEP